MVRVVKLGRDNYGIGGWSEFGVGKEVVVFFGNGRNSVVFFFKNF